MKKFLSIILLLTFLVGMSVIAYSDEQADSISVSDSQHTMENTVKGEQYISQAPERDVIAEQMEEYYKSEEIVPQGNNFIVSDVPKEVIPETDKQGESKLLRLPLYRQSHNFTCGVACVASVLRYAGYDFDTREDKLLLELAATPEDGTNSSTIVEYLRSVEHSGKTEKVLSVQSGSYDCELEKDEKSVLNILEGFRTNLDEGKPIICAIQAWKDGGDYKSKTEDDGHYVVLIGYKKEKNNSNKYIYYFMDPSTSGSYTYLTEDEFILRWHDEVNKKSVRFYIIIEYLDRKEELLDIAYHLG